MRRTRVATSLLPVISGVLAGSWVSRIPDIRRNVGINDALWGGANAVDSAFGLVVLGVILLVVGRANVRVLALASSVGMLVVSALLGFSSSVPVLIGLMIAYGLAGQLGEVPRTALNLEVQRRYRRPVLGSFTACWSAGSFAGGGVGALCAAAAVSPGVQLASTSVVLGSGLALTARWIPSEAKPPHVELATRILKRLTPQLGRVALLSLLTAVVASVGEVWGATYVADTLHGGAAAGAVAVTGIAVTNTGGSLFVDRLIAKLGRLRVFVVATVIATAGALTLVVAPGPIEGIVGFALVGLGTSAVAPMLVGSAAEQPGITGGEAAAVVEVGQAPAWMLTPLIVGFISQATNLRVGLLVLPLVLVAQLALAPIIARSDATGSGGRPHRIGRSRAPTESPP